MDIAYNLLLCLHIAAFVVGGANGVAMPLIGGRLQGANPEMRGTLFAIGNQLAQFGKIAMGVLLITGPVMILIRYGGFGNLSPWFWIKMLLVVVMLVSIVKGGISFKKAQKGQMAALHASEAMGKITGVAFIGVLVAAVFAFS